MVAVDDLARQLAGAAVRALPAWVERSVDRVYREQTGGPPPPDVTEAAASAGKQAAADLGPQLDALLAADIDEQRSTPLTLLREAVSYPTRVLAAAGVEGVARDGYEQATFPADVYRLTPATFADFGPEVADAGIGWGAAKAFEHKRRHRG